MDWKFTDKAFLAIVMTPRAVLPIKAALADRKKVVKTGSIFMGRGMGRGSEGGLIGGAWAGAVQEQVLRAGARNKVMARVMGRGSRAGWG